MSCFSSTSDDEVPLEVRDIVEILALRAQTLRTKACVDLSSSFCIMKIVMYGTGSNDDETVRAFYVGTCVRARGFSIDFSLAV